MSYNLKGYEFEDDVPEEEAIQYLKSMGISAGQSQEGADTSLFRDIGGSLVGGLGSLVELGGAGLGLATGSDPENILTKAGGGIRDFARDTIQSEGFRQQRDEVEQRLAELGDKELGKQISGTLGELFTNPYYLLNLGVEQAPQLLGGAGAGLAARGLIRSAAKKEFRDTKQIPSLTKEQKQKYDEILNTKKKKGDKVSPEKKAENYLNRVTQKSGVGKFDAGDIGNVAAARTGIGAAGALQGADVAKNTYDEIMGLPPETLSEYPEYLELINQGLSGEQAQKEIATRQARDSFVKAGLLSLGTASLLPNTLEKGLFRGFGDTGRLKGAGKGAFMEGLQETAEEGGGALITGFNVQDVDPTRDPYQGVGVAGTMGGTLGGFFGLGAGAIRGPQVEPKKPEEKKLEEPKQLGFTQKTAGENPGVLVGGVNPLSVDERREIANILKTPKLIKEYAEKNKLTEVQARQELKEQLSKGVTNVTAETKTNSTKDVGNDGLRTKPNVDVPTGGAETTTETKDAGRGKSGSVTGNVEGGTGGTKGVNNTLKGKKPFVPSPRQVLYQASRQKVLSQAEPTTDVEQNNDINNQEALLENDERAITEGDPTETKDKKDTGKKGKGKGTGKGTGKGNMMLAKGTPVITDQGIVNSTNGATSVAPAISKIETIRQKALRDTKNIAAKQNHKAAPITKKTDAEQDAEAKLEAENLKRERLAKQFDDRIEQKRRAGDSSEPDVLSSFQSSSKKTFQFKNDVRNEDENLNDIFDKAKGTEGFLNKLTNYIRNEEGNDKQADTLVQIRPFLKDVTIERLSDKSPKDVIKFMADNKAHGTIVYNSETGKSKIFLNSNSGMNATTILHELIHAATIKRISVAQRIKKNKKLEKSVGKNNTLLKSYEALQTTLSALRTYVKDQLIDPKTGRPTGKIKTDKNSTLITKLIAKVQTSVQNNAKLNEQIEAVNDDINSITKNVSERQLQELFAGEKTNKDLQKELELNEDQVKELQKLRKEKQKLEAQLESNIFRNTAFENTHELVAYAMSDPLFQSFLKNKQIMRTDLGPILDPKTGERLTQETRDNAPPFYESQRKQLEKEGMVNISLFKKLFDAIFSMLGLRYTSKLVTKRRLGDDPGGVFYSQDAMSIISNQFEILLAIEDSKLDKVVKDAEVEVPGAMALNQITLAQAMASTPIRMFGSDGNVVNLGGKQNHPAQTPYGISKLFDRFYGDQKESTINKFIQKFVNDRVYAKAKEEEITNNGDAKFENELGDNGYNLVFTALTNMNGLAEGDYLKDVKGLSDEVESILEEIVDLKGSDSETAMSHINNVMTALHDKERRVVNKMLYSKLTETNEKRRAEIMAEIYDGDTEISNERIDQLRAELEQIIQNDPEAQKYDFDNDRYQVSHLKPSQRDQILDLYEKDTEIKEQIDNIRDAIKKLNGTKETDGVTISLNKAGNYWSKPVDRIKRLYGFDNYVPLKGLPQNEDKTDMFNFSSRKISGELQDRVTAMEGRTSESDNVLTRSFVDASQATLRKHKNPVTLAVHNLVAQKKVEGTIERISFKQRATTKDFDKFKNPEYIFHYAENGDVLLVKIKDKNFRESVRRTYRETNPLLDTLNGMTAKMGQFHTRYNPNFPFLNYIRDLLTNAFIFGAEYGPGAAFNIIKKMTMESGTHLHKTFTFARLYNGGKVEEAYKYLEDSGDPFMVNLAEYIRGGGRIAYLQGLTTDNKTSQFEEALPTGGALGETGVKLSKAGRKLSNGFDIWMDTFELTARSIAYSEAKKQIQAENIEQGRPPIPPKILQERATAYAKNLANFEQTGEYGKAIGAFAMFFRPSATGALRSAEAIMKGKHGGKMALVLLGAGASTYLMSLAAAGEDEQGRNTVANDDMTRWTRYWRIHLGDDKVLQIPYGFGNGGLLAAGAQLAALLSGNQTNASTIFIQIHITDIQMRLLHRVQHLKPTMLLLKKYIMQE